MLNLKVSIFVLSLVGAFGVGAGTTYVINVNTQATAQVVDCKPVPPAAETFRHVEPKNTGRDKEY